MRRSLIAVILSLAFCWNCVAQQAATNTDAPASKEDVERYLQAINYQDMLNKMIDVMSAPMHQMVHEQYIKDQDKLPADFEAQTNQKVDAMIKDMPWDDMTQAMVPSYQKHFTKGDMDTLTAFYTSPTGQKVLREMPAIMAESMQTMVPIMQKHMEAVNRSVKQQIAGMLRQSQKTQNQNPTVKN
jgi:uncharacterized protein